MSNGKTIFISACEASADIHCANLIKALKEKDSSLRFVGLGGENMAAAGCELLENTVSKAAMAYKVFSQLDYYITIIKKAKEYFQQNKIDLTVVCDSPAFNFHIAKAAKKMDIKTFFYVAPQLWAWAPWRIHKLKRCCDKLACILPFEQEWFTKRNMPAVFVGNPLLAGKRELILESAKDYKGYNPNSVKIALMPGSREAEIKSLWSVMQKTALRIQKSYKNISITAVALNERVKAKLQAEQIPGFNCDYTINSVFQTARENDFTLVASGSATLEVAAAGCPMMVMYQSNKLLWHLLGKFLIKTRYLSLVNILAGSQLVPELMPYLPSDDVILRQAMRLIQSPALLKDTSTKLTHLTYPLALLDAPQETANLILQQLEQSPRI